MAHVSESCELFQHTRITGTRTIRILVLEPGPSEARLQCSFCQQQLRDREETAANVHSSAYAAISYTWHDDPETETELTESIFCGKSRISISQNLSNLLKRLRHISETRRIWVDQLCIDQNNAAEKAQQIPLMGAIYRQASSVIFWVGEETSDTALAFELAGKLEQCLHDVVTNGEERPTPDSILNANELAKRNLPSLASGSWWPLLCLFSRPVFSRLWIVQEVALASNITLRCGSYTAPFSTFGSAAAFLQLCHWLETLQIRYLMHLRDSNLPIEGYLPLVHHVNSLWNRRQRVQSGEVDTLENLLFTTRRCALSREWKQDRIFGVLGLITDSFPSETLPEKLSPSYDKSYEDVYTDAVIYLLRNGSLTILSGIEDTSLRPMGSKLPSWVPDFSIFPAVEHFGMHAQDLNFRAGAPLIPPTITPTHRNLNLRAYKLDTISLLSDKCPSEFEAESLTDLSLASFFESACSIVDTLQPYPTGEDTIEAFWRCLIADSQGQVSPAPDVLRRHFVGFCLQSAVYVQTQVYVDQFELEGEKDVSMEMVVDRAWDEARMARVRKPEEVVLGVNDGRYVVPVRPKGIEQYASGLWKVFTRGIYAQIMEYGVYPRDYLTNSNGAEYRAAMKRWCQNRRVFNTEGKGYFGLGSGSIQRGDGVWVLQGGTVPFVLRKTPEGTFRIVGECYVHGIMRGEALASDCFQWEDFEIV